MSIYKHHSIFALCFLVIGLNCASTEPMMVEPKVSEENVSEAAMDPDTSQSIEMEINARVKYEFTKVDTSWTGFAVQYDSNDPETRKVVRTIPLVPTYGWSDFEDMAKVLHIYSIPDQKELKNHEPAPLNNQSRSYGFTVFDGDSTRSFYYYNPEGEASQYWQSQNVLIFGAYITTEMKGVDLEN